MSIRNLATNLADSAALTNSTAETVLASLVLPAYHAQVGKRYRVRAQVRATATNSTDTLAVDLRFGPTTLTGTVIASAAATDVADNNVTIVDAEVVIRAVGTAGGFAATGLTSALAAEL